MATNNAANIGTAASGKVLQGAGVGSALTFSTPTYPSASGTSRKILVSDGTNNVYSTETWAVPGTSGNVLTSDGTNWTSAAPSSPILKTSTVTWSNASLKAGTAVTVLTGQGAGSVIVPVQAIFKFVYGGNNAFTGTVTAQLNYSTTNGTRVVGIGPPNGFWTATSNQYCVAIPNSSTTTAAFSVIENTAVSATLSGALAGNAAGDNTVLIVMTYFVVTI